MAKFISFTSEDITGKECQVFANLDFVSEVTVKDGVVHITLPHDHCSYPVHGKEAEAILEALKQV